MWNRLKDRVGAVFAVNALPLLLYSGERACCAAAGISMDIPWGYFQLLDRNDLLAHPFWSLFFLHSQPPVLNALLAIILRLSAMTGVAPFFWADVFFTAAGAAVVWGFFRLALRLTSSLALATVGTVFLLMDPGTHVFQHQYFYPLLLQALLIGMALFSLRFLSWGRTTDFCAAAAMMMVVCNTSTLYHPLWALLTAGLLVAARRRAMARGTLRWPVWAGLAALAIGVTVWPLKNLAVFGQFTYSTWEGLNLARGTEAMSVLAGDEWRPEAQAGLVSLHERFPGAPLNVVAGNVKCDGSINQNQYGFVTLNPRLTTAAVRWRFGHPGEWAGLAVTQYAMWTRASYADGYREGLAVPGNEAYRRYALAHWALFYADLRPLAETASARWASLGVSRITGRPVPLTLFGWGVFPLILIGTLALNWKPAVRQGDAVAGVCLLMALCILWVMGVPCLTDGQEGNRMRFAVDPFILALGLRLALRFRL